jgi:hypothetical protein
MATRRRQAAYLRRTPRLTSGTGFTMVRKEECSVRTIVLVVVHVPMLRRVLVEIGMVRRDLCHFRVLARRAMLCSGAPRLFLLRFSKLYCGFTRVVAPAA